jgi:hypothetical protein
MTNFIKNGNTFKQYADGALDTYENLPTGTYTVKIDPRSGEFYYEEIQDFTLPPKFYGNNDRHTSRIINTFKDRESSTGIVLSGEKGSGKTLLAKRLSVELLRDDIPTIVINTPLFGEGFNTFIQELKQPAVVIFDEYEKVYDYDKQEKLLTLLDGVYPTKKLFIFTCNDAYRVQRHMKNRPGRVFYLLEFKGLDRDFIIQYAEENLNNKDEIEGLVKVSTMFADFNFDMLKALVEEMNRYDECAKDAVEMLNCKPDTEKEESYKLELNVRGKPIKLPKHYGGWDGNPFDEDGIELSYRDPDADEDNGDDEYPTVVFHPGQLTKADMLAGIFVFTDSENSSVLTVTKNKKLAFDYMKLF